MRFTRVLAVAGLLTALSSTALFAQQGAVEFGLDAGLIVSINDGTDNLTAVCIPCQRLRIGFFVSDAVSFEPDVALNVLSGGGETLTTFSGGVSLLFHFTPDPDRARVFFRGGAGIDLIDLGGSASQFNVSGGIGVKTPASPLGVRLEGIAGYGFENDDFVSSFNLGALIGFSFFTG